MKTNTKHTFFLLVFFLLSSFVSTARADYVGTWSGSVSITSITSGENGDFVIVAPNAPAPGSCNGTYRVAIYPAFNVDEKGVDRLYATAMSALLAGKRVSIFRSNDALCYVGFVQIFVN